MQHAQRALQIFGLWRLTASFVGGVIMTIGVSWWIELEPFFVPVFPFQDNDPSNWAPYDNPSGQTQWAFRGFYSVGPPDNFLQYDLKKLTRWWDTGCHSNVTTSLVPQFIVDQQIGEPSWHNEPRDSLPEWNLGEQFLLDRNLNDVGLLNESATGWPYLAMVQRETIGQAGITYYGSAGLPASLAKSLRVNPRARASVLPMWPGFFLNTLFFGAFVYAFISLPACTSGLIRRSYNRCHACGYRLEGLISGRCPECNWRVKKRSSMRAVEQA